MESMVLRPVRADDHADLLKLAKEAGFGMTSLPQDEAVLSEKIENVLLSFKGTPAKPNGEAFLFVLEDVAAKKVVGCTGIKSHVGMHNPFYSYKISTITQASKDLDIYSLQKVLHMVNDYTGATEIGSLFLLPEYRKGGMGRFLSRSRFLVMAEFPQLFSPTVIAEMRGVHDEEGDSPFYNNLARHFFQMPFWKADYTHATQGGQFIADLMPKYPIYVALLTPEAQSVLSKPHPASAAALKMLEREGFYHANYVDVFDGGPTVQAERLKIRTVRQSHKAVISGLEDDVYADMHIVATTHLPTMRQTLCPAYLDDKGGVVISPKAADLLQVKMGDTLRIVLA